MGWVELSNLVGLGFALGVFVSPLVVGLYIAWKDWEEYR